MTVPVRIPSRPVEFAAGSLWLRSASREDVPEMLAAVTESAAALSTTMAWWRDGVTGVDLGQWLDSCESGWDEGRHLEFSVLGPDRRFLGSVGLGPVRWASRGANASYWVRTSATGQGVGRTAVRAAARWACGSLGLQRVEIVVVTGNLASRRLAASAGATREGVRRNALRWAGRPHDAEVFSFVPGDFDT